MIISDTSVWIEFLKKKEPFFTLQKRLLEERQVIALECIFGELLQGAHNMRESTLILDYWNNLPKIEEKGLWIDAGSLSGKLRLSAKGVGLIDAFILKAADASDSQIWTLDRKLTAVLPKDRVFAPNGQ